MKGGLVYHSVMGVCCLVLKAASGFRLGLILRERVLKPG